MSTFISKMNTADALAKLCRQGHIPVVTLNDTLSEMGFAGVKIDDRSISVVVDGNTYELRST